MGEFIVKKFILPSGKVVEIVYLRPAASDPDQPQEPRLSAENPAVCPDCPSSMVYATGRHETDAYWALELRCPECYWTGTRLFSRQVVERFDKALNNATDALIDALENLTRENMEGEIERFVFALEGNHIVPFDF